MSSVKSYFDLEAENYQAKSSRGLWARFRECELKAVMHALKPFSGMSCLELGCGSGYYTAQIASHFPSPFVAVDFSDKMLRHLDVPEVIRVCGDIRNVSFRKRFDRILCAGALEFIPDIHSFLSHTADLINENGRMVLLLPKKGIAGRFYQLFHKSHGVDIRLYQKNELEQLLKKFHWTIQAFLIPTPITYVLCVTRDSVEKK